MIWTIGATGISGGGQRCCSRTNGLYRSMILVTVSVSQKGPNELARHGSFLSDDSSVVRDLQGF